MKLIALSGLQADLKAEVALGLARTLIDSGASVTLLDNNDHKMAVEGIESVRFGGGCVCCSMAAQLFPAVWKLKTDYALLVTSSAASPETLAYVMGQVRGERVSVATFALIDDFTRTEIPYLADQLTWYADCAFSETTPIQDILDAALNIFQ